MFASNQVLKISGDMQAIQGALDFALAIADFSGPIGWQVTEDNRFCIGKANISSDWKPFDFSPGTKVIAAIIEDWISKQDMQPEGNADGAYEKGFLMEAIESDYSDASPIKNSFLGIVSFRPYTNFYAK